MLKRNVGCFATMLALILGGHAALGQGVPASGFYQIVSGQYIACCGFGGPFIETLPDESDAFIQLTVDLQRNIAQMSVLGRDMQTVLRIEPEASRSEFTYLFTNGLIFPDHIQFDGLPMPDQPYFSYVVSNITDSLFIGGTVVAPCPGCADIPDQFAHTNLVAVSMPRASVRVSEVEVCWNTASNRTYQVQYRSALTTNNWTNLGSPVVGEGSTSCTTDKVQLGDPQRYYRVLTLP